MFHEPSLFFKYCRQTYLSGITDTEQERIKESAAYVARRNLFATGEGITATKKETSYSVEEETHEKKSRKVAIREKAERLSLKKTVLNNRLTTCCFIKVLLHDNHIYRLSCSFCKKHILNFQTEIAGRNALDYNYITSPIFKFR